MTRCFSSEWTVFLPRLDIHKQGTLDTAFVVRLTDDLRGRTLHVRVGIWLQGTRGRHTPHNRFLPAVLQSGEYDVLVSVGLRDGTLVLALPLAGRRGVRPYRTGTVSVRDAVK